MPALYRAIHCFYCFPQSIYIYYNVVSLGQCRLPCLSYLNMKSFYLKSSVALFEDFMCTERIQVSEMDIKKRELEGVRWEGEEESCKL